MAFTSLVDKQLEEKEAARVAYQDDKTEASDLLSDAADGLGEILRQIMQRCGSGVTSAHSIVSTMDDPTLSVIGESDFRKMDCFKQS